MSCFLSTSTPLAGLDEVLRASAWSAFRLTARDRSQSQNRQVSLSFSNGIPFAFNPHASRSHELIYHGGGGGKHNAVQVRVQVQVPAGTRTPLNFNELDVDASWWPVRERMFHRCEPLQKSVNCVLVWVALLSIQNRVFWDFSITHRRFSIRLLASGSARSTEST